MSRRKIYVFANPIRNSAHGNRIFLLESRRPQENERPATWQPLITPSVQLILVCTGVISAITIYTKLRTP